MADQGLINYIERSQAAGISKEEIIAILLRVGWSKNLIEDAFGATRITPPSLQTPSSFEKLRIAILIIIGMRILLIPFQYFFLPLALSLQTNSYYSLPIVGNLGGVTMILPIIWILPFLGIIRREKSSYIIAILFSAVLIYLNLFGLTGFLASSPQLYVFSVVYALTGIAIIVLSLISLGYFPGRKEEPNQLDSIDESRVPFIRLLTILLFGITVIAPGLLGLGFAGSVWDRATSSAGYGSAANELGVPIGMGAFVSVIIAFVLGSLLGWMSIEGLITRIRKNQNWTQLGVISGLLGGAIAQIPLYDFSVIQMFAMPIGGVIGIFFGLLGIGILHSVVSSVLKK